MIYGYARVSGGGVEHVAPGSRGCLRLGETQLFAFLSYNVTKPGKKIKATSGICNPA